MIEIDKKAIKDLEKLSLKLRKHILDALERLDKNNVGDVKKLKGLKYYRLRVGGYRILFKFNKEIISVIRVLPRDSAYKNKN